MLGKLKTVVCAVSLVLFVNFVAQGDESARPVPLAVSLYDQCQFPSAQTDVMGFRLCLGYGRHANVSGLDIGVLGCGVDGCLLGSQSSIILNDICVASGALQIAGVANNCLEDFGGFQIAGIANSVGGVMSGGQCGSFNVAKEVCGAQIGVFNKADKTVGIQIGVFNWTSKMQGIQLGVLNVIERGSCPYMPLVNMAF